MWPKRCLMVASESSSSRDQGCCQGKSVPTIYSQLEKPHQKMDSGRSLLEGETIKMYSMDAFSGKENTLNPAPGQLQESGLVKLPWMNNNNQYLLDVPPGVQDLIELRCVLPDVIPIEGASEGTKKMEGGQNWGQDWALGSGVAAHSTSNSLPQLGSPTQDFTDLHQLYSRHGSEKPDGVTGASLEVRGKYIPLPKSNLQLSPELYWMEPGQVAWLHQHRIGLLVCIEYLYQIHSQGTHIWNQGLELAWMPSKQYIAH